MPLWRPAFWACAALVLVLSLMPSSTPMPTTGWDKSNHFLGFALLAGLGLQAYPGRTTAMLIGLLGYGGLIEVLQSFTPDRRAEWGDLLADGIGIFGVALLHTLATRLSQRINR